jgi:hypothetical protein
MLVNSTKCFGLETKFVGLTDGSLEPGRRGTPQAFVIKVAIKGVNHSVDQSQAVEIFFT